MVHLGGCGLVLLADMVLTLITESPANLICFLGLMALFSGTNVSEIIRVIGSISNASDYKLWYSFRLIFHFERVLLIMVLKGNIVLVIVRISTLGGCCGVKMMFIVISLWEGIEVLEVIYCDIIGMSKFLGLRWDLFLLSDVPSPVRMS